MNPIRLSELRMGAINNQSWAEAAEGKTLLTPKHSVQEKDRYNEIMQRGMFLVCTTAAQNRLDLANISESVVCALIYLHIFSFNVLMMILTPKWSRNQTLIDLHPS